MDLNERGIYYPVLGICFGIQFMLGQSFEPSIDPTSRCIGMEHKLMPLNFTLNARESKLFRTMPEKLYKSLASENIAGHFHTAGVSMKHYNSFSDISKHFAVTATNHDDQGMEFISTMESKRYPFYGLQWHPEKAFFMNSLHKASILHQPRNAYKTSLWFSRFLFNEAMKNNNTFLSMNEQERFSFDCYETNKIFSQSAHIAVKRLSFANFKVPKFDSICDSFVVDGSNGRLQCLSKL